MVYGDFPGQIPDALNGYAVLMNLNIFAAPSKDLSAFGGITYRKFMKRSVKKEKLPARPAGGFEGTKRPSYFRIAERSEFLVILL